MTYFSTLSNNAESYQQKINIINLISFLTVKMNEKDPEKYPNSEAVLSAVFDKDLFLHEDEVNGRETLIRAFGMLADDLLWGTKRDVPKPEGFSNMSEIVSVIKSYFNDEWKPF